MTNTYDTSNEPLGSTAVKVLYNNASNLDEAVNSAATTWVDRPPFSRSRLTLYGAEQQWLQFLQNSGFETVHLTYVDGVPLTVDRPTQLIDRAGSSYRVKLPASFPVELTGTWATDQLLLVDVADAALRQDLVSPLQGKGVDFVAGGFRVVNTLADLRNFGAATRGAVFVIRHSAGKLGGGVYRQVATGVDDNGYCVVSTDGTIWQRELGKGIEPEVYGVLHDSGNNDTAGMQAAFDFAYSVRLPVLLGGGVYTVGPSSAPGATYAILSKGVSVIGVRAVGTQIVPHASLTNDKDFIQIQPESGVELSWMELRNFLVYPGADGTKRGKRAIVVNMANVSNGSSILFDGVYCAPGNDLSLDWVTDSANNPQGGPANTVFTRSHFWEGARLVNHGDSVSFEHVVFRSSAGSGRIGLSTEGVSAGGGQPAQLEVENCNFDCDGGAFVAKNGLSIKFNHNNVEQSHGTGSSSSAVVDFEGTANTLAYIECVGNNFGVFGTADVGQVVRLNNTVGAKVGNNRFLSAGAAFADRAILITASCTDIEVSPTNEIDPAFPETIQDNGVGTRGVPKLLTPLNGFGNAAGDQPLIASRDPAGSIWVAGSLTCPASASGQLFGSLPAGWRYAFRQRVPVSVISGGNYYNGVVVIDTNGDLVFYSDAPSPESFQFNVRFGGLGFNSGNV